MAPEQKGRVSCVCMRGVILRPCLCDRIQRALSISLSQNTQPSNAEL